MAKDLTSFVDKSVVDTFYGIGRNSIGFAKVFKKVVSIDTSKKRIEMAKFNAGVYGVKEKIEFIRGDFLGLAPKLSEFANTIFLDPPWGGSSYILKKVFLFFDFKPAGNKILESAFRYFRYVALKIPGNFKVSSLKQSNKVCNVKTYKSNDSAMRVVYFY